MIVRYQLSFPIPSGILDQYSISVEADMNSSNPEETVHLNVAGAIATITLARPHLRNALDRKTMKSLIQVALDVSDRDDVRAVVIAAEGADFAMASVSRDTNEGFFRERVANATGSFIANLTVSRRAGTSEDRSDDTNPTSPGKVLAISPATSNKPAYAF